MKPETKNSLIIWGYFIAILCVFIGIGVILPTFLVIRDQETRARQEQAAWEEYKTANECKKIGTIYPDQTRYECADGYIYTRVE